MKTTGLPLFSFSTICITLLFFISTTLTGQEEAIRDTALARQYLEEGKVLIGEGRNEEARKKLVIAQDIFVRTTGGETLEIADCYHQIGRIFYTNGENDLALSYFQNSLAIRLEKLPERHLQVAQLYYNIGNIYLNIQDFESALMHHKKSLTIREELLVNPLNQQILFSLGQTGFCYIQVGDFLSAKSYLERAIQIQEKLPEDALYSGWLYGRLGYINYCINDLSKAVEFHEKAIFLITGHPTSKAEIAWNKTILGNCYALMNDYSKSEAYLNEALDFFINQYGNDHLQVAQLYNDMGYLYLREKKYEKAKQFHERALSIRQNNPNNSKDAIGQSYVNLGDCNFGQDKFKEAIKFYTEAYENRLLSIGRNHPFTLICLVKIASCYKKTQEYDKANYFLTRALQGVNVEVFSSETILDIAPNVIIYALSEKIDLFYRWHIKHGIESHILNAIKTADIADKYIDFYSKKYEDNLFFLNSRQSFFENATRAIIRLNEIDKKSTNYKFKEFYYSEKCKSLSLYGTLQNSNALSFADIPDDLFKEERRIRVEISQYEKKRQEKLNTGQVETDTSVLALRNRIFNLKQEHDSLKHHLEINYPEYYRAKYDLSVISVEETQQQLLRPGEALLEYFVGDSAVFVFVVRPDTFAVLEIPKDFALDSLVTQLRNGIYSYYDTKNPSDALYGQTAQQYTEAATILYDRLIAPVQALLPKRLYIVPDGVLGYVPFEALLMERPAGRLTNFHSHRYFGKEHIISYAYSATLLREMRAKKHRKEPQGKVLAMAPFFRGDARRLSVAIAPGEALLALRSDTLKALPHSGDEALRIAKAYKGKSFLGQEATKAAFEQQAANYRILHLSTHGVADDRVGDYAWLGFAHSENPGQFEKLYVRDIYNLSLNADLVVLSACQAGIGKLQRGEGIISLSRAFAYAGAKSILTTLWSVEDEKTKDFMLAFYRHLQKMPRAEALHQARLEFLNKRTGEQAHPYYWAAFIGVGDM